MIIHWKKSLKVTAKQTYITLSLDGASESNISPCIKLNKPSAVYIFKK